MQGWSGRAIDPSMGQEGMNTEGAQAPRPGPAQEAAWGAATPREAMGPARLTVLAAVLLYLILPEGLTLGAALKGGVTIAEAALLFPLTRAAPRLRPDGQDWVRSAAVALIAVVNLANALSLVLLVDALLHGRNNLGHVHLDGPTLILAAVEIWLTNVLVCGLWYWEFDQGGRAARRGPRRREPDFLVPQMATLAYAPAPWTPGVVDDLSVAVTNATAFSPTDTLPLTPWAEALMLVQSLISLLIIALVAARAVNILT